MLSGYFDHLTMSANILKYDLLQRQIWITGLQRWKVTFNYQPSNVNQQLLKSLQYPRKVLLLSILFDAILTFL